MCCLHKWAGIKQLLGLWVLFKTRTVISLHIIQLNYFFPGKSASFGLVDAWTRRLEAELHPKDSHWTACDRAHSSLTKLNNKFLAQSILLDFFSARTSLSHHSTRWELRRGWQEATSRSSVGTFSIPCPFLECRTGRLPRQFQSKDQSSWTYSSFPVGRQSSS